MTSPLVGGVACGAWVLHWRAPTAGKCQSGPWPALLRGAEDVPEEAVVAALSALVWAVSWPGEPAQPVRLHPLEALDQPRPWVAPGRLLSDHHQRRMLAGVAQVLGLRAAMRAEGEVLREGAGLPDPSAVAVPTALGLLAVAPWVPWGVAPAQRDRALAACLHRYLLDGEPPPVGGADLDSLAGDCAASVAWRLEGGEWRPCALSQRPEDGDRWVGALLAADVHDLIAAAWAPVLEAAELVGRWLRDHASPRRWSAQGEPPWEAADVEALSPAARAWARGAWATAWARTQAEERAAMLGPVGA